MRFVLELAADAGDHPLFEGGIGLGAFMGFFEQVMHGLGLLVSRLRGGIVVEPGFKLRAFLGREFAVQRGDDQVVERIVARIVRGKRFHGCAEVAAAVPSGGSA